MRPSSSSSQRCIAHCFARSFAPRKMPLASSNRCCFAYVYYLEASGVMLLGQVPDPGRSVAEDGLAYGVVEAAAFALAQQFGAFGEADPSGSDADRAQRPRRQRAFVEAEGLVVRGEAAAATVAVIPGPLETERSEQGGEGLLPAPGMARLLPARARKTGALVVRMVGVEAPGQRPPHSQQRELPGRGLDDLEVETVERSGADHAVEFGCDFRLDLLLDGGVFF